MGKKKRAKKAEAQVARLKKSLAAAHAELEKTRGRLEKAKSKATRWKREAKANRDSAGGSDEAAGKQAGSKQAGSKQAGSNQSGSKRSTPDDSWTVAQLRDEAKARGLTGMSSKPKAELLRALR